jgi:VCBS repeat-containing protein
VSITITPVNDNSPVANGDSIAVDEGVTAMQLVGGAFNLLDNDTDADLPNDTLTLTTTPVSAPSNGSLSLNSDGTFSYLHDGSENFSDSFVYEVRDAAGAAGTATVSITITPVNDNSPVANGDSITVDEGATATQLVGGAFNLLDNDTDADLPNDTLTLTTTPVSVPSNGTLSLNSDGTFSYLHDGSENFSDSFVYEVRDAAGATDTATVSITITPVNDPPNLSGLPDLSFVQEGMDNSIDLDDYYTDVETSAAAATFLVDSSFAGVSVSIDPGTHVLTVTGDVGFSGEGDITIQVIDTGDGASPALPDTDTLHVTVLPVAGDSVLLLVLDETTTVGGVTADNEDVIIFDGSTFSVLFDGSDVGIGGAKVDGFSLLSPSELLLSFTSSRTMSGIDQVVDDSDIVKFTGTQFGDFTQGTFEIYFDGSDVDLTGSDDDIDAFELLPDGRLLVSITGSSAIMGLSVTDEDLIAFTPTTLGEATAGAWAMYFDGSDVNLSSEDLKGVSVDANGDLYFAVQNEFSVGGVSGDDEDVFMFTPATLGADTSGTFLSPLYFDGSQYGISSADLSDIDVTPSSSLPSVDGGTNASNPPTASNGLVTTSSDVLFSLIIQGGANDMTEEPPVEEPEVVNGGVDSDGLALTSEAVRDDVVLPLLEPDDPRLAAFADPTLLDTALETLDDGLLTMVALSQLAVS